MSPIQTHDWLWSRSQCQEQSEQAQKQQWDTGSPLAEQSFKKKRLADGPTYLHTDHNDQSRCRSDSKRLIVSERLAGVLSGVR